MIGTVRSETSPSAANHARLTSRVSAGTSAMQTGSLWAMTQPATESCGDNRCFRPTVPRMTPVFARSSKDSPASSRSQMRAMSAPMRAWAISASRSSTSPGSSVEVRSRLDSASTSSSRALWSNSSLIVAWLEG